MSIPYYQVIFSGIITFSALYSTDLPESFSMKKLFAVLSATLILAAACGGPSMVTVTPKGIKDPLRNPGRGFATTHQYNSDIGESLHPASTVVQFRWYWDKLEPEEGQIRFGLIDSVLARCRAEGQQLNFRVMCQNGRPGVPLWVREAGAMGAPYTDDPNNWQPRYDDPVFLEKHANLIRALAEHYDGHPDLFSVDIGSVGRWGEWHTQGTGMDMPDDETANRIVDHYLDNWKKTPLIMLIGGDEALRYAVAGGAGWRADCLGDMGGFNDDWNHMEDFYQQALDAADANDAWKTAPVIFETCWTVQYWYDKGWDIDFILSEALRWHVTELNNATEAIPEQWWQKVVEFEKKMGYRLALRRLVHPSAAPAGSMMLVEMEWENEGVAPSYRNYPLTFSLRNKTTGEQTLIDTGADITSWLPGAIPLQLTLPLPGNLTPGEYELGLALMDAHHSRPEIELANDGRGDDGWYRWSILTVH